MNVTEIITGRVFVHLTTNTFIEILSLHPDYVYEWVVTAVTVGIGPYTYTVSVRTPEDGEYSIIVYRITVNKYKYILNV